jgi:hypothetical protein
LQQFWRDTDAARKRRGLQPPSRTSFRVHFPIYLFAWQKGNSSIEARKRFEKGVPLKAFPTASKKSLFLEDAAGGRGGGDPTPLKRSRSLISPPCRAGGMRRARERPEFGRGGRGISRVAGASAETWGNPHRRAQPFQTGSFFGKGDSQKPNEVANLIGLL